MRSIVYRMTALIVALLLMCGISVTVYTTVYGASAKLTGTTTVRAGDTITLTLVVSDSGKYGLEGTLSYDSSKVTLNDVSSLRSGWEVERNGNTIIAYDNNMTNPLGNNTNVLKATFKVNSNIEAGTTVTVSIKDITTTTGSEQGNLGTASYSVSIAKPLSTDNNLSGLSVDGYKLSPAFSAGTTTYSIGEVDYNVSSLNVKATKSDSNANVTVTGNQLSVGANTVTITVKAQNGSTKVYKIKVTRKQNPNYVASSNANVSSVTLSSGKISPKFDASITSYVVYLPYEEKGSKWEMKGNAQDGKSTGVESAVIESLAEGNNVAKLVCTAENGTTKTYNVTVVVMPKYSGGEPATWEADTSLPQDSNNDNNTDNVTNEDATGVATDNEEVGEVDVNNVERQNKTPVWFIIIFVILAAVAGFGACYVLYVKK